MSWQAVIGIEVHVQLKTEQKLFCGCTVAFGAEPNRNVCPVCLALPGALPVVNADAVRLALRTALAVECTVHPTSIWARKNYVYADLPKGYQITQFEDPIATHGHLDFDKDGDVGRVRIRRIHMEEDAGKSVHDRIPGASAVDLNRAGTPLVEIVTEPDLHTASDTRAFLTSLKHLLEFMDVSDCNMEEGSLRADANVSLRRSGADELGTKTEIKNVNSFSGIEKAIELEIARQTELLENGGSVESATLLWDDHRETLRTMRSKEESHDYRYFPEPDLPPLLLDDSFIAEARSGLPERPRELRARLESEYGLSRYDADVLSQNAATAGYYEEVARTTQDSKRAANWVMGPVQAALKADGGTIADYRVSASRLAELIALVRDGVVSDGAGRRVLEIMRTDDRTPEEIIDAEGVRQVRDEGALAGWIEEVIAAHPDEVERYRAGEGKVLGFLMGRVMGASKGSADPKLASEALRARLSE